MRRVILVEDLGRCVKFRLEGCDVTYTCTQEDWKLKLLREKLYFERNVPEILIDDLIDAARDVWDEENSWSEED